MDIKKILKHTYIGKLGSRLIIIKKYENSRTTVTNELDLFVVELLGMFSFHLQDLSVC